MCTELKIGEVMTGRREACHLALRGLASHNSRFSALRHGAGSFFGGAVARSGDYAQWAPPKQVFLRQLGSGGRERHVNILKESLRRDAANSVGGFDEIIARPPNVFVAERIGERQR